MQTHEMKLERTYDTGAEEWHCPTCGRRFLMYWEPYSKLVLQEGDNNAAHSGGKGGLQLSSPEITS